MAGIAGADRLNRWAQADGIFRWPPSQYVAESAAPRITIITIPAPAHIHVDTPLQLLRTSIAQLHGLVHARSVLCGRVHRIRDEECGAMSRRVVQLPVVRGECHFGRRDGGEVADRVGDGCWVIFRASRA